MESEYQRIKVEVLKAGPNGTRSEYMRVVKWDRPDPFPFSQIVESLSILHPDCMIQVTKLL